ncbi:MAG: hypothetical protein OHK0019_13100 [Saprospiraceae bacterium]
MIVLLAVLPKVNLQSQITGQRISIHTLSGAEQAALANLINDWLDENINIVDEHDACFEEGIHSTNNFLPWHRVHIQQLEDYIRENADAGLFPNIPDIKDESFRLPYWRPEEVPPAGNKIPTAFQATASGAPLGSMNFDPPLLNGMSQVLADIQQCTTAHTPSNTPPDIGEFSDDLEQRYHDNGHIAMSGIMVSPRAPDCLIFWPWHAWVDDIWYYWENHCKGEYDLPGTSDIINPNQFFTEVLPPGTLWTGEMFVKGEVRIKDGATLTIGPNAIIHFRESGYYGGDYPTRIIVEPGGTLVVDGATLTGIDVFGDQSPLGDDPGSKYYTAWEGIVVQGGSGKQGWVQLLNNARIEHAVMGIRSENGGQVYASNANFYNNRVDVEIGPHTGECYASFFHCKFINDQPLRDIIWRGGTVNNNNGCGGGIPEHHINHEDSHSSDAHIVLNGAGGLWKNFLYCTIDNTYQDPHGHYISRGIVATNSQYFLYGCGIKNQVIGISGRNTIPGPGRHATIRSSSFQNNLEGITLLGVDNSEISTNNTFTVLDDIPTGVVPDGILSLPVPVPFGIYSDGSAALTVADNDFSTVAAIASEKNYGAILANTGSSAASMEKRNAFTGVGIGSQAQGGNGNLQIRCNDYNSFQYGIALTSGTLQTQGLCASSISPAGNIWDNFCGPNPSDNDESQVFRNVNNSNPFTYWAHSDRKPTCYSPGVLLPICLIESTSTSCDDQTAPCVGCEESRIAILEAEKSTLTPGDEKIQFITHEQQSIYQQGVNERLENENEGLDVAIAFTENVEAITSLWPGNRAALLLLKSEQEGIIASGTTTAIAAISESDPTKKWFNLRYDLLNSGRTYSQLTAIEKAMVEVEAAQNTKSGAHAKAILEMAYGIPARPNIEPIDGERNAFSSNSGLKEKILSIMPNPAQDNVIISFTAPETAHQSSLEIIDINGHVLRQFDLSNHFSASQQTVPVDGFSPGIYLVMLNLNGVLAGTEKIVVIR